MKSGPKLKPFVERFWSGVNKNGPTMPHMKTRCWKWAGTVGRGRILVNGKMQLVYRIAFFLKHGHWPMPKCLHKCDNPNCVRWSHLFAGTPTDNMMDCVLKGRTAKGSKNGQAILTTADAKQIRALYATGEWSQRSLAGEYEVTVMVISNVINRKSWRHV